MFRKKRETELDLTASELGRVLHPLPVVAWGPLALAHLGVPIIVGIHNLVVRDEDYQLAIQKFLDSGFKLTEPNRNPPREVMDTLPDPRAALEEISSGYRRLDRSSQTLDYPTHHGTSEQIVLTPDSFSHLNLNGAVITQTVQPVEYDTYGNISYPRERMLLESFVKAAVDEEGSNSEGLPNTTAWSESLRSWIAMMMGYLGMDHNSIENPGDLHAVAWYSRHFGRNYELENGPMDRRITKRVGSGKELPYDMMGASI